MHRQALLLRGHQKAQTEAVLEIISTLFVIIAVIEKITLYLSKGAKLKFQNADDK